MPMPTPVIVHARNKMGMPICGANIRKRPGKFCQQTILFPNGRCRLHKGGPTKEEQLLLKNRRAMIEASLPPRLREVFNQSVDDPMQLSMKIEVGLMDANLTRIMETLEDMPSPENWKKLKMVAIKLERAIEGNSSATAKRVLKEFKEIVEVGNTQSEVWEEMQTSMIQRAKIAEVETKRMVASKTVVTVVEAEMIVTALFRIMADQLDVEQVRRIKDRFVQEMSFPERALGTGPREDDLQEETLSDDE